MWQRLFSGIQDSNFEIDQLIALLDQFAKKIETVKDFRGVSELLLKILKRNEIKVQFNDVENKLFAVVDIIWTHRKEDFIRYDNLINTATNTELGNVLLSSIYMISYCNKIQGIPERYKNFLEKNLKLKAEERNIVLCILAGHFNFCI